MSDQASSSLSALVVVMACALVCGAASLAIGALSSDAARAGSRLAARAECDAALADWIARFHQGSGEADSPFAAYAAPSSFAGAAVVPLDISSRINPNWVRSELLSGPALSSFLLPGLSGSALQAAREEEGALVDIGRTDRAIFAPEAQKTILTAYSYADLNTCDIVALEKVYSARTGDPGSAAALRAKLASGSSSHRRVAPDELKSLLYPHFAEAFPVMCVAPPYNANFAPPELLAAVLALPECGISDHADRANALVARRKTGPVTLDRLVTILGVPKENPVYDYLGTKTWFWKVLIESKAVKLEAIVARIPPSPGYELKAEKEPEIRVISREYS